jgi:hypothetical protein
VLDHLPTDGGETVPDPTVVDVSAARFRRVGEAGGPDDVQADRHAEHVSPFPPHMLGNDVAEHRQVSGRQPPHHLGRLVEV